jgi:hypothetical protein
VVIEVGVVATWWSSFEVWRSAAKDGWQMTTDMALLVRVPCRRPSSDITREFRPYFEFLTNLRHAYPDYKLNTQ